MSDQLPFLERLWWVAHYRAGVAAINGERVHFAAAPPGLEHAIALDYVPSLPLAQLQTKYDGMRDMTAAEEHAAQAFLATLRAARSEGPA